MATLLRLMSGNERDLSSWELEIGNSTEKQAEIVELSWSLVEDER